MLAAGGLGRGRPGSRLIEELPGLSLEVFEWTQVHEEFMAKERQPGGLAGQDWIDVRILADREFHFPGEVVREGAFTAKVRVDQVGEFLPQTRGYRHWGCSLASARRRGPSVLIPEYELQDLFQEHQVFERLASGELSDTIERGTGRPGRRCCVGGFSYFTRIRERDGQEVGRVHYLECVFGIVLARYPSHIIIDGVLYHRQRHQRRPSGDGKELGHDSAA